MRSSAQRSSLGIAARLCLLLLPLAAQAHFFACVTNDDQTITITGYIGGGGDVRIPASIDGLPVTVIGYEAFYGTLAKPTTVTIPDSVTNIETFAFIRCMKLTDVTIGSRVASIGDYAFAFCGLTNLTLPDSLTTISDAAFINCRFLPSVAIPDRVTRVGPWAFEYCAGLTDVVIGNSVTNIGYGAFRRCPNLMRVRLGRSLVHIETVAFDWCPRLRGAFFRGNAPSIGVDIFDNDDEAVVYRLPEATRWEETFGNRPTALWTPEAESNAAVRVRGMME